jgi:nitrogen regulatory protein PII
VLCDRAAGQTGKGLSFSTGHTGKIGDGKIWCYDLTRIVRIRTGARGDV